MNVASRASPTQQPPSSSESPRPQGLWSSRALQSPKGSTLRMNGHRRWRLHSHSPPERSIGGECQMGYGVIGSPTGSGPVSLGSSPGTPARRQHGANRWRGQPAVCSALLLAPLCSGLARRPLKAVARVRIPSGLPEVTSHECDAARSRTVTLRSGQPSISSQSHRPNGQDAAALVRRQAPTDQASYCAWREVQAAWSSAIRHRRGVLALA